MKLLVPYFGELRPADARLIRLAEFLGISCTSVSVEPHLGGGFSAPNAEGPGDYCLVVNPEVIRQCLAGADPSPDFVSKLFSRFRRFFIHSVRSDGFHAALVAALTGDCFSDVRQAQAPGSFKMPPESRDVCGAFAGLSIPVQNLASECVFSGAGAVGKTRSTSRLSNRKRGRGMVAQAGEECSTMKTLEQAGDGEDDVRDAARLQT